MKRLLIMLPMALLIGLCVALAAYGPIAQPLHYHAFADTRVVLGVPNGANVLSNLAFAAVGLYGLARLWPTRRHPAIAAGWHGHLVFLLGLVLTAAGSAYYHLAPDNDRLVWDRLPMTLICAGLLAVVRAETGNAPNATRDAVILSLAGIATVVWWQMTEQSGEGDLRPYLVFQFLPFFLIPVWMMQGRSVAADRDALAVALGIYLLAKGAEFSDRSIMELLGFVSGHTLKHVLAAAATAAIVFRLTQRVAVTRSGSGPGPAADSGPS